MAKCFKTDGTWRPLRLILSAALGLALTVTMIPAAGLMGQPAYAADKDGPQADSFVFEPGAAQISLREEAKDYPAAFDLRNVDTNGDNEGDTSFITPVKIQNPYGTCWGFAAAAVAESSLLASGLADDPEKLDLSEKHLAYFSTSYIDDPDDPQNGEGMHFKGATSADKKTSAYRYNIGGFQLLATSLFASGIGPNDENAEDPDDVLAYRGKNGEKVSRRVATAYDAEGKPTAFGQKQVWYSSDDDWSISDDYRFVQSYRLKDSFILPSPCDIEEDSGKYKFNEDGVNAIKQQMYENHRAVSISYLTESFLPGQDTAGKQFMSSNWAHYTNMPAGTNHAVTVVGWDDNYPKENFDSSTKQGGSAQPEGDGAFLIKNSWGSELNEFPNNGFRHWGLLEGLDGIPYDKDAVAKSDRATGYFWLSYYDESLDDPETFEFDKPTGNGYYVEQHDYMQPTEIKKKKTKEGKMANVFTAEATSTLSEISAMTVTPGTKVEYQVYLLGTDYDGPEDGELLTEGQATFEYGGYHKIELEKKQALAKDQKYSVVIKETSEKGGYVPYSTTMQSGAAGLTEHMKMENVAVINKGESFIADGGKWKDLSAKAVRESIMGSDFDYMVMDNFPIKSYLEPVTYNDGGTEKEFEGYLTINNYGSGTVNGIKLLLDREITIAPEFRGIKGDMPESWDPVISWENSDPSVIEVKEGVTDTITLKAVKAGKTFFAFNAGKYGKRLICVEVRNPKLTYMAVGYPKKMVYTGKALKPKPVAMEDETTSEAVQHKYKEGVDYKLSYKNNINAGTATVTATGIGRYAGSASDKFIILKAKNTLKAKGKTATVSASRLAKKAQSLKRAKVISISKAKGTVTFKKKNGSKKILISKKGKVTVKKGLAKGTYKVTVKVKAKGTKNYKAKTKTVTFRIRVK